MRQRKLLLSSLVVIALFPASVPAQTVAPALTGRPSGTDLSDRNRSMKKGALIGMFTGAIAFPTFELVRMEKVCGPVRGTSHACDDEWDRGKIVFVCGSAGAAVGAAVGALIGHAVGGRKQTSGRISPGVTVAPSIGRVRKSVNVSIVF